MEAIVISQPRYGAYVDDGNLYSPNEMQQRMERARGPMGPLYDYGM
jgi:hypothetical protein